MADKTSSTNSTSSSTTFNSSSVDTSSLNNADKITNNILKVTAATTEEFEKQLKLVKDQLGVLNTRYKLEEKLEDISNDTVVAEKKEYNLLHGKFKIMQDELRIARAEKSLQELEVANITSRKKLELRIVELKKLGLNFDEASVDSKESLLKVAKSSIELDKKELSITKEQTKELNKQLEEANKKIGLGDAIKTDLKRAGSSIKGFLTSTLGQFFSAATFASGFKDARAMLDSVYDSYWRLSVPVNKMSSSTLDLVEKTKEYETTLWRVKTTASKWGFDIDKVSETMSTLASKVRFMNTVVIDGEKRYEPNIKGLGDVSESLIAFSRVMRMDVDDAISLYEERVRKFGDTSDEALKGISNLASATLSFNDVLGNGAVFADEIGKHLLEVQQNTRYWTQDMGMLNTMMNAHVNLLISQGKSQKQALEISKAFEKSIQEPPDLIKWTAGKKLLMEYKQLVKGLNDDEAVKKLVQTYGITEGQARSLHQEVKHGGNTGYSNAILMQEVLGGTRKGAAATIGAYTGMMDRGIRDISVLKDSFQLGDNLEMASNLKQLFIAIRKDKSLGPNANMEDAMRGIGKRMGFNEKEIEGMVKAINKNGVLDETGKTKESDFQNVAVNTLNKLEKWLEDPFVKMLGGTVGMGASLLTNSAAVATIVGSALPILGRGGIFPKIGKFLATKQFSSRGIAGGIKETLTKERHLSGINFGLGDKLRGIGSSIQRGATATRGGLNTAFPSLSKLGGKRIPFPKSKGALIAMGGLAALSALGLGSSKIGSTRGGKLAMGTAETALAVAGPVGAAVTAVMGGFEGAFSGRDGKKIESTLAGAIAGFLGPIGKISEALGFAGKGASDAVGDFNNLVGVMDGMFGSYDPQERASVSEEAKQRLKSQGYETDMNKVKKAGFFGPESKESFLAKHGMNTGEGVKYYNKLTQIAKQNLQSKFGGDVSDEDVQAETQRIIEDQLKTEKNNAKTQDSQLKTQEDLLKITKKNAEFEKVNSVDEAIDRINSSSDTQENKVARLQALGLDVNDDMGKTTVTFGGIRRVVAATAAN